MSETRYFLISGRVQGVGFRAAACDQARRLALAGWVRNRADGCVEVTARGAATDLAAFKAWLDQGPAMAQIDEVTEGTATDTDLPSPFTIE